MKGRTISLVPLAKLKASTWNPKLIRSDRFKNLCIVIAKDPGMLWLRPILAQADGTVYAGHQRREALIQLWRSGCPDGRFEWAERAAAAGIEPDTVPADLADVDEKLAQERGLADNNAWGEWVEEQLSELLYTMEQGGTDLALLGFEDRALEALYPGPTKGGGKGNPDAPAPAPPKNPITQPGDLWLLGKHRVYCGSATDPEAWSTALDGKKAALCLTDPPYGVGLDYDGQPGQDTPENVAALAKAWLPLAREHAKAVVFTCGVTRQWLYPEPNWVMAWHHSAGAFFSSWGFSCWQPLLCYGPDPSLATGHGRRPDAFDVNVAAPPDVQHPCPKPVSLWELLIERLSFDEDDLLVDCFGGSGTTLIAAEQQQRATCIIELSPAYCDVIVERWQTFTGQKAVREPASVGVAA